MLLFLGSIVYKDAAKTKRIANSTMMGYYSALKYHYSEREVPFNSSVELSNFLSGYQKQTARARENGELPSFEGKQFLSLSVYRRLALYALKHNGGDSISAHLYMILCWNVMGRSNTTAHINMSNIKWDNDCIIIDIPRHKGDQTGEFASSKHIFANLQMPEICPILAMALYVFSNGFISSGDSRGARLFDGANPEATFNRWLHVNALRNISEEELGMKRESIGSHSFRKGAATHVSSFDVVTETNVNFRAGWNQGRVRGRYIFGTPGADQLIGRILCGLNIHNCLEFLSIPAHFHESLVGESLWQQILVDFNSYPVGFRSCLPYLLASLCYHSQWVSDNCHVRHPIFHARVWRTTGVPTLWAAIGIFDIIDNKLSETNVVVKQYHDEIKAVTAELPSKVCEVLQENYSIQGVAPITVMQMRNALHEQAQQLLEEIRRNQGISSSQTGNESPLQQEQNSYQIWTWGGALRFVPQNFVFPYCTSKNLWDYWLLGTEVPERIRPFRMIPLKDLSKKEANKMKKAKMLIETILRTMDCTVDVMASKSHEKRTVAYDRAFSAIVNEVMKVRETTDGQRVRTSRFSQLQWITILNDIVRLKIKKVQLPPIV
eukprot:gene14543-16106_t